MKGHNHLLVLQASEKLVTRKLHILLTWQWLEDTSIHKTSNFAIKLASVSARKHWFRNVKITQTKLSRPVNIHAAPVLIVRHAIKNFGHSSTFQTKNITTHHQNIKQNRYYLHHDGGG